MAFQINSMEYLLFQLFKKNLDREATLWVEEINTHLNNGDPHTVFHAHSPSANLHSYCTSNLDVHCYLYFKLQVEDEHAIHSARILSSAYGKTVARSGLYFKNCTAKSARGNEYPRHFLVVMYVAQWQDILNIKKVPKFLVVQHPTSDAEEPQPFSIRSTGLHRPTIWHWRRSFPMFFDSQENSVF